MAALWVLSFATIGICACSSSATRTDAGTDATADADGSADSDGGDTVADEDLCYEGISDCCGNGLCEDGETDCGCPRDCDDCYQHLWQLKIGTRVKMMAFDKDGYIIGKTDEEVLRISPAGQIDWRKPVGWVSANSPPVLTPDGSTILAASTDNVLYWLDLDGEILRQRQFAEAIGYPANGNLAPATDGSKVILTPRERQEPDEYNNRWAYWVRTYDLASGEPEWEREWEEQAYSYFSHPSIDSQGNVYVTGHHQIGDTERRYYLFKYSPTGELLWTRGGSFSEYCPTEMEKFCCTRPPAIGKDDMVVYSNGHRELLAYSSEGQELWNIQLNGYSLTEPVIGPDGTIYSVDYSGEMLAIRPDGTILWRVVIGILITVDGEEIMNPAFAEPILTKDGYLIVPMYLDTIRVVRASDGEIMYDIADDEIFGYTFFSPLLGDDGVMYFTIGYWIFAVQTQHTGLANGYWVRARANNRNNSTVNEVEDQ